MPEVHVFIVNYNSSHLLRECLSSLEHEPVSQIHVVDNFVSHAERARVVELMAQFDKVHATLSDSNSGFGPALNAVIRDARLRPDDIIWLLNPDTTVNKGTVAALLAFMESGYDLVSPTILTGDPEKPHYWFSDGVLDRRQVRTIHVGYGAKNDPFDGSQTPHDTTFLTGAAMMMRSGTWEKIGGFQESFFLYWEDADLSERATAMGFRLGVARNATIWHEVGGSEKSSGMSATYYYHMQRNRLWFGRRWLSRRQIVLGSGSLETLLLVLRPLKEKKGRLNKTFSSIKGLVHGLVHSPL